MRVWVMDAQLTTRVTLINMMGFDGREVGRSAKSFEVPHVPSTHRLSAKGSCDASLRVESCLLYTSPSPRDLSTSRMPSSA